MVSVRFGEYSGNMGNTTVPKECMLTLYCSSRT